MDRRENIIQLVDQDMRRALRLLGVPVHNSTRARVRVGMTQAMWRSFYPALTCIPDDENFYLEAIWEREEKGWRLLYWVATNQSGQVVTKLVTEQFGLAAVVSEVEPGPLPDLFESDEIAESE